MPTNCLSSILILLVVNLTAAIPNYFVSQQQLIAECNQRLVNYNRQQSMVYQPQKFIGHLPGLSLPYLGDVPIPNNIPQIKPTPPTTTKVVAVVTKYVSKHPICIKMTSKKPACKLKSGNKLVGTTNDDITVTKELRFRNRNNKMMRGFDDDDLVEPLYYSDQLDDPKASEESEEDTTDLDLQGSESPRKFDPMQVTPTLRSPKKVSDLKELLIEDRLDRLEVILPHYKRLRTYETSTITVTKTTSNNKAQATLLVKNCIPEGIEFCDSRRKQGSQDLGGKMKGKTKRKKN